MSAPTRAAGPAKANWNLINRRWHANLGMFAALTLGIVSVSCFVIAHKAPGGIAHVLKAIHFGDFLPASTRWVWIDLQGLLLLWLIVSGWLIHWKSRRRGAGRIAADSAISSVLLYEGDSPRAAAVAHELSRRLASRRHAPVLVRLADHAQVDWSRVASVLVLADSVSPSGAESFVRALSARTAPSMRTTRVAGIDLADGSTPALCAALLAKGARSLLPGDTASEPALWQDAVVSALAPAPLAAAV